MRLFRKKPVETGTSPVRGPLPASVKAMAKERGAQPVFPLRDSYGRTWAERKELGL